MVSSLKSACIDSSDVQRLQIDQYDGEDLESLAEEAMYEPAVDTGGVRRQFFSDVFSHLSASQSLWLFEGPGNRQHPVFRQVSISSGMLTLLRKMVCHSILMDCQGFPFLSPACMLLLATWQDIWIQLYL